MLLWVRSESWFFFFLWTTKSRKHIPLKHTSMSLPLTAATKNQKKSISPSICSDSEVPTKDCLLYWHFANLDISHKRVRAIIGCFFKNQNAMHALPVDCIVIQDWIGSSPIISSPSVIPIPITIPILSRFSSGQHSDYFTIFRKRRGAHRNI